MEQKRTLWIIAAVGVFLLFVLGAALIFYSPKANSDQFASAQNTSKASDSGWISLAPAKDNSLDRTRPLPPVEERKEEFASAKEEMAPQFESNSALENSVKESSVTHVGELTVYADKATFYTTKGQKEVKENTVPQTVINNTTTIDLTGSQHPVVIPPKSQSEVRSDIRQSQPSQVKPAYVAKNNVQSSPVQNKNQAKPAQAKAESSKPAAKSAAPAATKANEKIQYWVQVTSLTSRKNADNARELLGENKIPADVFTYTDSNNRLFYRVRVGPYTTKSEAEYWRGRINEINEFKASQSYVASTKVTL
ncbi:MAG: SPOR domain-containing protein [Treponema sp.]|nr:SPOR domain-containing protein [Treponema sp.]